MKKLINTIIGILIACCILSCNNNKSVSFCETGEMKEQYEITNGKKNGKYIKYYKDGKVAEMANYINDKQYGIHSSFYKNGKLKIKKEIILLREQSVKNWFISYDSTGNIIQEKSHFYKVSIINSKASNDSVILKVEINPYKSYDRLLIFKGNYNANYYLEDSLNIDTIDISGNEVTLSYVYDSTRKDNILRSKIFHYKKIYTENGDSLREGRFLYFSEKIH